MDAAVAVPYFVVLDAFSLPADVYATFVRPHRAGFSDQSFAGWLGDSLVNWGVFTLFCLVGVLVIYGCMRRRPKQWVAWAIGVYAVLRVLYALLSPNVIEPLTNDFRPLPEGAQKQQILALARENGVDDVAVVTGDPSRQTRLLNAHVSGFAGTARISVADNGDEVAIRARAAFAAVTGAGARCPRSSRSPISAPSGSPRRGE